MWEGRADKGDEYEEEELDPRVEVALTAMNTASDDIIRLEPELQVGWSATVRWSIGVLQSDCWRVG